jgi:hypothetical protein
MEAQPLRSQFSQSVSQDYRRKDQQSEKYPEKGYLKGVQVTGNMAHAAVHGRRRQDRQQHGQDSPKRAWPA